MRLEDLWIRDSFQGPLVLRGVVASARAFPPYGVDASALGLNPHELGARR